MCCARKKTDWDAHQRKKDIDAQVQAAADARTAAAAQTVATGTTTPAGNSPVKLNSNSVDGAGVFDPGDTYRPPHTVVASTTSTKKISDVANCLIWVNHDCEIATLDQKYLRLSGAMDPATHEWKVKDRARLDALLQMAEIGARRGIAFAEKAEVNPSILAMIYERAAHERIQGDDASALDALRNYWRCALLGNVCWQLAHTPKAQPVEAAVPAPTETKTAKNDEKKSHEKPDDSKKTPPAASTNIIVKVSPPSTNEIITPIGPAPKSEPAPAPAHEPPVVPIAHDEPVIPVAPIAAHEDVAPTPPVAETPAAVAEVPTPVVPVVTPELQPAPPRAAPVIDPPTAISPSPRTGGGPCSCRRPSR